MPFAGSPRSRASRFDRTAESQKISGLNRLASRLLLLSAGSLRRPRQAGDRPDRIRSILDVTRRGSGMVHHHGKKNIANGSIDRIAPALDRGSDQRPGKLLLELHGGELRRLWLIARIARREKAGVAATDRNEDGNRRRRECRYKQNGNNEFLRSRAKHFKSLKRTWSIRCPS